MRSLVTSTSYKLANRSEDGKGIDDAEMHTIKSPPDEAGLGVR